ncbi:class I SAM-dependent methyltransferase [Candidatus Pelagibacter sp. RS40]|uniref:class I SAM-dependent methyltransferase n=1 Tax=Candidatus Pelagibacter sp. RS40 TaxID=1977865 RepID=UPI0018DCBC7C|nr:class I SAM-dependent methyltransferase [Candidatus Pelagibacter sp. RS40]
MQKNSFQSNYGKVPKEHFNKIFYNLEKKTILDFGCATGDKLLYFIQNNAKNLCGIDINKRAIRTAEKKFQNYDINYYLSSNVNKKKIDLFLKKSKSKMFDIIILDRVLYILKKEEFNNNINYFSKITKYMYLDDFFLKNNNNEIFFRKNIKGYTHSNFDKILDQLSFKLVFKGISPYKSVKFSNPMSALYKLKK